MINKQINHKKILHEEVYLQIKYMLVIKNTRIKDTKYQNKTFFYLYYVILYVRQFLIKNKYPKEFKKLYLLSIFFSFLEFLNL